MNSLFIIKNQNPRGVEFIHETDYFNFFTGLGNCATLNLDADNNVLVLDLGIGYEDLFGTKRSGWITISYLSSFDNLQNQLDISFNNHNYQETAVEGSIEITKVLEDSSIFIDGYESSFSNLITSSNTTQLTSSGSRLLTLRDNTTVTTSTEDRRAILTMINNFSGTVNGISNSCDYDLSVIDSSNNEFCISLKE